MSARGYQPALTVARLVLERPSPLLREELAELLWPHERPPRWEGPARQVVSRARALLVAAGAPAACLTSRGGHVELRLETEIEVDVEVALEENDRGRATATRRRLGARPTSSRPTRSSDCGSPSSRLPTRRGPGGGRTASARSTCEPCTPAPTPRSVPALASAPSPLAEEAIDVDPFDEVATRALMAAYEALGQPRAGAHRVRAVPAPARRRARSAPGRRDRGRVPRAARERAACRHSRRRPRRGRRLDRTVAVRRPASRAGASRRRLGRRPRRRHAGRRDRRRAGDRQDPPRRGDRARRADATARSCCGALASPTSGSPTNRSASS